MAAPEYLHLGPVASGVAFWGGILVFLATVIVVFVLSVHEESKRKAVLGPIITMAVGALIFGGGAAWYFWPASQAGGMPPAEKSGEDVLTTAVEINGKRYVGNWYGKRFVLQSPIKILRFSFTRTVGAAGEIAPQMDITPCPPNVLANFKYSFSGSAETEINTSEGSKYLLAPGSGFFDLTIGNRHFIGLYATGNIISGETAQFAGPPDARAAFGVGNIELFLVGWTLAGRS
jgi:hypothetical protein